MKKRAQVVVCGVMLTILLCGTGCTSYRVCGHAPVGGWSNTKLKHTYRLLRIDVRNASSMPMIVWTTEFALAKTPMSAYERLVTRNRPDVFAEHSDSIPITVELTLRNSTGSLGWTILVPYLVTLGIFPAQIQYDDICDVTVRRQDAPYVIPELAFRFQHKMMVTAFSPIGLGGFGPDPTATAERSGSGIMMQPEINMDVRNNIAEALAETLSATIVEQLRQMEERTEPTMVLPAASPSAAPYVPMPLQTATWAPDETPVTATYSQAVTEADAAVATVPALAALKPYTIDSFSRVPGDRYVYQFVLKLNNAATSDLSVSRLIQTDIRQYVLADYMASSGTTDAASLRVDFPQYAILDGKVEGRAVVMAIELLEFIYEPATAHGRLAVKMMNSSQYDMVRQWVRNNIATLAKDKGASVWSSISLKPRFTIGREVLRDGNVLEVEFQAGE